MRGFPFLVAAALGALLAAAPVDVPVARATGASPRPDTMPVEQVRRGMKGYGLTVFEGTTPERFGVEVIDVLKNWLPAQDLIIIKTDHPRLDVTKTVAGMSGSPIFIGSKMIGAYAYGWPFGSEPVAGVTPIENMLADLDRPLPRHIFGWPLELLPAARTRPPRSPEATVPLQSVNRYAGTTRRYELDRHAAQLTANHPANPSPNGAPAGPRSRALGTPLLLGGLTHGAARFARELFEPLGLQPVEAGGGGGGIEPGSPQHFADGSAIGVELMRGDISSTQLGTVTRVEGDRAVAFGHSMMEAGVTALPTAVARVLWVLASEQSSQKFAHTVRPLGALVSDRQASVVVVESAKAPVVPVSVHIEGVPGAGKRDWAFELAHERFMTPSLLAIGLGSALQATSAERQDVTWRAVSEVKVRGHGSVRIEDFGVATGGNTPDPRELANSELVGAVGGILNNPWQEAFIEGVSTRIELSYARELVRLREARALETELDAGEPLHVALTLVPYAGPPIVRTLTIPIPAHLSSMGAAGQKLKLTIRPGHAVLREKANPENLDDLLRNVESPTYPPRSVVVSYRSGAGVAFQGRIAERLPPGALDSIQQDNYGLSPEPFASEQRHVIELPDFMVGSAAIEVTVRPRLR
jgi:hypothetical protein